MDTGEDKAFNPFRDTVFQGNQSAYDKVGNVAMFVAGSVIPVGAALKAGEPVFSAVIGGVGKTSVTTAVGVGTNFVVAPIVTNLAKSAGVDPILANDIGIGTGFATSIFTGGKVYKACGNGPKVKEIGNSNKYSLSGEEHYENLKDLFGADNVEWVTKGSKYDNAVFADDEKLVSHYWKHGKEFGAYSLDDYLNQARDVMNNGYEVNYSYKGETRTGFLEYYGNSQKNEAKFAFVGTNNEGFITTFHTESGKTFWKMLNGQNIKVINPK